jgi:hypothetical protein
MRALRDYYRKFGRNPTDVELETFAQTWSEHCKHKIFNAAIEYTDDGRKESIDSLFKTYVVGSTNRIRQTLGKRDFCLSVFKDNAGIIKFNKRYNLAYKVETHNTPSALDPYGGALTGIVGVNRDPFGSGKVTQDPLRSSSLPPGSSPLVCSGVSPAKPGADPGADDAGHSVADHGAQFGKDAFDFRKHESFIPRPDVEELDGVGNGASRPAAQSSSSSGFK